MRSDGSHLHGSAGSWQSSDALTSVSRRSAARPGTACPSVSRRAWARAPQPAVGAAVHGHGVGGRQHPSVQAPHVFPGRREPVTTGAAQDGHAARRRQRTSRLPERPAGSPRPGRAWHRRRCLSTRPARRACSSRVRRIPGRLAWPGPPTRPRRFPPGGRRSRMRLSAAVTAAARLGRAARCSSRPGDTHPVKPATAWRVYASKTDSRASSPEAAGPSSTTSRAKTASRAASRVQNPEPRYPVKLVPTPTQYDSGTPDPPD